MSAMGEGCCLWVHRPTERIVCIQGDGCNEFCDELSIKGWNRMIFDKVNNMLVVEEKDDCDETE